MKEENRKEEIIISLFSYRGGTGKSTLAANIGVLTAKKGIKTLLIDLDIYAPQIKYMFEVETRYYLNDLFAIILPLKQRRKKHAEIQQTITQSGIENLDLLLADPNISLEDEMIIHTEQHSKQIFFFLKNILPSLQTSLRYKVIILDCPGELNYYSLYATALADLLIGTLIPTYSNIEGMKQYLSLIHPLLINKTVDLFFTFIPHVVLQKEKTKLKVWVETFQRMGVKRCRYLPYSTNVAYKQMFENDYLFSEQDEEYSIVNTYLEEVLGV